MRLFCSRETKIKAPSQLDGTQYFMIGVSNSNQSMCVHQKFLLKAIFQVSLICVGDKRSSQVETLCVYKMFLRWSRRWRIKSASNVIINIRQWRNIPGGSFYYWRAEGGGVVAEMTKCKSKYCPLFLIFEAFAAKSSQHGKKTMLWESQKGDIKILQKHFKALQELRWFKRYINIKKNIYIFFSIHTHLCKNSEIFAFWLNPIIISNYSFKLFIINWCKALHGLIIEVNWWGFFFFYS